MSNPDTDVHLFMFSGFLGAGKTTMVLRLLQERGGEIKTAVIVNEFGEVGIDGQILKGSNVDTIELNSGCLCCTLKGPLLLAIEELHEKAGVRRIIVEASGIAQPAEMTEALREDSAGLAICIGPRVTVVDGAKCQKLLPMLGDFYERQIENAEIVVVNKADIATTEQLDWAAAAVRRLNPAASVLFAENGDVDGKLLFEVSPYGYAGRPGIKDESLRYLKTHDPHAGMSAESFVVDVQAAGKEFLRDFFARLPDNVWRVKGYVEVDGQTSLVQFAAGQLEITPEDSERRGRLIFIGCNMNREEIADDFIGVAPRL